MKMDKKDVEEPPACFGSGYDPTNPACELCPWQDMCESFCEDLNECDEEEYFSGKHDEFLPEEWDYMMVVKEVEEE